MARALLRRLPALGGALSAVAVAVVAWAVWSGTATGNQAQARAQVMPPGSAAGAGVTGRNVAVSWSAVTLAGGSPVDGYNVLRRDTAGLAQTVGAGCAGLQTGTSCAETGLAPGSWVYSVVPVFSNWHGAAGAGAGAVVPPPSMAFTSATSLDPNSLPATMSASLAAYLSGETVAFRLDDAASGTVLAGSTSPSPMPYAGGGSATVTIPAGVATGGHRAYAVGSGGPVASAAFPALSEPSVSSIFITRAGTIVAVCSTFAAGMPAFAYSSSSRIVSKPTIRIISSTRSAESSISARRWNGPDATMAPSSSATLKPSRVKASTASSAGTSTPVRRRRSRIGIVTYLGSGSPTQTSVMRATQSRPGTI